MTGVVERGRAWRVAHPAVAEVGIAVAAAILVTVVAVSQWGTTSDSLLRGLTLGTWLGVVVWAVARRRRVAEERVRRQGEMARDALRLELARELHDTLAGEVAVIGIQAAAARRVMDSQPAEAAAAMQRIEVASRAANADLRRMLEALRSGDDASLSVAPGLGDLAALADAQTLGRAGAISVAVDEDVAATIDVALDRTAYRIAEEAIRNARRHAGPVAVDVTATIEAGELCLVIENGPGRAASEGQGSGLGLVGMRERAAVFGGSIDAGPTPSGGFRVAARLPIVERRAAAGAGA